MDHLAWYPALKEGRLTKATWLATCLEKPRDLINRWIVTRHEELALTDPDAVDEHEAGTIDPWPEAEPPARLLPAPETPETKASGANKELSLSAGPHRTSGAYTEPQESAHREEKHTPATHPMVGEDPPTQEHWDCGTEKIR